MEMKGLRVVGIDLSLTGTGISVIEITDDSTASVSYHTFSTPKSQPMWDRQISILRSMRKVLKVGDRVVFEDYANAARFQPSGNLMDRVELLGMAKLVARVKTKTAPMLVLPRKLKSFVTGKADSHKTEVQFHARTYWKLRPGNNNEADGGGLAVLGLFALIANANAKLTKIAGDNALHFPYVLPHDKGELKLTKKAIKIAQEFGEDNPFWQR